MKTADEIGKMFDENADRDIASGDGGYSMSRETFIRLMSEAEARIDKLKTELTVVYMERNKHAVELDTLKDQHANTIADLNEWKRQCNGATVAVAKSIKDRDTLTSENSALQISLAEAKVENENLTIQNVALEGRDLNVIQGALGAWQSITFPSSTAGSKIAHLAKEVIELQDGYNKFMSSPNRDNFDALCSELADALILTIGAVDCLNANCADIIERKMEINISRKWGKPDENGVVEHIREAVPSPQQGDDTATEETCNRRRCSDGMDAWDTQCGDCVDKNMARKENGKCTNCGKRITVSNDTEGMK